jgi:molybdopterin synthase sulfur carrier subunit
MATVRIPALLRPLTGDVSTAQASGATLRAIIDDVDRQFPGVRDRLLDGDAIRGDIAFAINGEEATELYASIGPEDELYILPAIAGGNN